MAVKIESSVLIARVVEEVFPFVLEMENIARAGFDQSVVSVEKTPNGPLGCGRRGESGGCFGGKVRETTSTWG